MNVDIIFKIGGIGLLAAILHTILKQQGKAEYAYIATLAGVIIVFTMVITLIDDLFDSVRTIFQLY